MTGPHASSNSALLSVAQMHAADAQAIAMGITGVALMQAAGRAVVRELAARWAPRPTLVLCGPGNNGGDGFVVASELAAQGWPVRVALWGARDQLRGDAAICAAQWGGEIETVSAAAAGDAELCVDALFGSGVSRPLPVAARQLLESFVARRLPIAAIDTPSGVHGDTGESLGAVAADCTVTFVRKKPGHVLLPGRDLCGECIVTDIGIPPAVIESLAVAAWENAPDLWLATLPQATASGNKYTRGHALIGGGYPMTGAARMAARAAARMGAGLTSIAVPEIALPIYASALTSIMVHPLGHPADFTRLLADPRYTAFMIGPGAGVSETTRQRVRAMLGSGRPVLLDADALTCFTGVAAELFEHIVGPCVLTPHEGEFKRLFDVAGDKLIRARAAARTSGAVIVLKGADTVVAAPDGRAIVNSNAPPSLATAGAGDVLGGMILGLLAQGVEAFLAAATGVWMHGAAAQNFGPGLMAEDLPDLLPGVLRHLVA